MNSWKTFTFQDIYKVDLQPISQEHINRIGENLLELGNTIETTIAEQAALLARLGELLLESSVNRQTFAKKNKKWCEQ